jgi:hydroxylamine reductase
MECPMFCYQCEQTNLGQGCVEFGVCGKDSDVALLQDLLVYQLEGLSFYAQEILKKGQSIQPDVHFLVIDALFSTLTNVNFDRHRFIEFLKESQQVKSALIAQAGSISQALPAAAAYKLPDHEDAIILDSQKINLRPEAESNLDVQSLKDTFLYGMKGMAAYAHHAWMLDYSDEEVSNYFYKGLAALINTQLTVPDLVGWVMEFGKINLKCMELLDRANTTTFGHPEPTHALISRKKGPFIIVSGHDLHDLKELLEQSAGKGVNVYTHGEMLPSLAYPELKKYSHLIGNYGGAWQNQQREFDGLPGCVVMTTNCLMEPRKSYKDRVFTAGVVGWADVAHIPAVKGKKDFSAVIEKAIALGGWQADDAEKRILIGFGRNATLSHADAIIEAVKTGKIRRFFLVGGCDGAKAGRNYYTEFAEKTPKDTVILTLACGKFRFNKKDFGTVAGLPRLLDIGQCNDAYSAIQIALALAGAFECGVNDLPLTMVLSWYEQKAVCILLTLLSLGIKNIYLGPSLPAFISPNVLQFLVEQFNIHPITTVEEDLQAIMA